MFWTIAGIVLAVVLIGAWLWDRRRGFDLGHRDSAAHDRASAEAHATQNLSGGHHGGV